jgi:hypothetical protein
MRNETKRSDTIGSRSSRYLFALLFAVALVSGLVVYRFESDSSVSMAGPAYQKARSFTGGKFEASGVVHVPGTDGVLFVDDGKPGEVFWMRVDGDGNQIGPIKAVRLGVNIEDPEGITTDGSQFYVVSSQSRSKRGEPSGIVRFKFDPATQSAEAVETISYLKRFLLDNVIELRDMDKRNARESINIEGLAWDPAQGQLLLGLRSPVKDDHALLVPLKLRDPQGRFSSENLEAKETAAMMLSLGGHGIRSIEYDNQSKLFRIIAGATESQEKTDFKLWEWGGHTDQASLREVATFDRKLKPEGVTRMQSGEDGFTFIVFDTSKYLRLQ